MTAYALQLWTWLASLGGSLGRYRAWFLTWRQLLLTTGTCDGPEFELGIAEAKAQAVADGILAGDDDATLGAKAKAAWAAFGDVKAIGRAGKVCRGASCCWAP